MRQSNIGIGRPKSIKYYSGRPDHLLKNSARARYRPGRNYGNPRDSLLPSEEHAAALLKNRLYRRWGIKTAREYARIKIDGLRLVGGNPDFTNAPGHGDDDARFYDRQQAYVHARGG